MALSLTAAASKEAAIAARDAVLPAVQAGHRRGDALDGGDGCDSERCEGGDRAVSVFWSTAERASPQGWPKSASPVGSAILGGGARRLEERPGAGLPVELRGGEYAADREAVIPALSGDDFIAASRCGSAMSPSTEAGPDGSARHRTSCAVQA